MSLTGDGHDRSREPVDGQPVDLHDDGILWLINRTVFHPRGYALAHDPETGRFYLQGDGTETWYFINAEMARRGFRLPDGAEPLDEDALLARIRELMP